MRQLEHHGAGLPARPSQETVRAPALPVEELARLPFGGTRRRVVTKTTTERLAVVDEDDQPALSATVRVPFEESAASKAFRWLVMVPLACVTLVAAFGVVGTILEEEYVGAVMMFALFFCCAFGTISLWNYGDDTR